MKRSIKGALLTVVVLLGLATASQNASAQTYEVVTLPAGKVKKEKPIGYERTQVTRNSEYTCLGYLGTDTKIRNTTYVSRPIYASGTPDGVTQVIQQPVRPARVVYRRAPVAVASAQPQQVACPDPAATQFYVPAVTLQSP